MAEGQAFELELNEESGEKLKECSRLTGHNEDEIIEYIITNYLQRQLSIIEKRSKDTGVPFNELLNMQFIKLLELFQSQGGLNTN